jgi:HKD family nuclease
VRQALAGVHDDDRVAKQAEIVNELLAALQQRSKAVDREDHLALPPRRLASVHRIDALRGELRPDEPLIPLAQSDLLVNARGEPSVGQAIHHEIASADRVDLLCAFIKWHGLRLLEEPLDAYLRGGGKLRVITTTYVGATERKAIDRLLEMGADVKISYQVDHTRLHAKAWLFHRHSGFSTAFIGSSNLSKSALLDGVEWNVRLSQIDAPVILEKFAATFDSYWADPSFETYSPADADRFDRAIGQARGETPATVLVPFAIEPWPHQREMLDKLTVERYRHNRWRNLVVAATGTGKTVVAALDYKRLCEEIGDARPLKLLFVAHRREILSQSLITFRHVMRDGAFGETFVDGHRPDEWQHVFASVQSLQTIDLDRVAPEAFDVVIVDEFHHAAAPTYRKLLDHFRPRVLLGLTATPERTDGESILHWFGDASPSSCGCGTRSNANSSRRSTTSACTTPPTSPRSAGRAAPTIARNSRTSTSATTPASRKSSPSCNARLPTSAPCAPSASAPASSTQTTWPAASTKPASPRSPSRRTARATNATPRSANSRHATSAASSLSTSSTKASTSRRSTPCSSCARLRAPPSSSSNSAAASGGRAAKTA